MIIKWYPEAIADLQQIARYIDEQFGEKCCNAFLKEVMNVEKSICANPQIGKEEPLLKNQPITYRSFVVARKDKLVYRIDGDSVIVVAFWDCRRNPDALVKQITNHSPNEINSL